MSRERVKLEHLIFAAGGALVGAWWVKGQQDEAKKSRAEREDPKFVDAVCTAIGPIIDDWDPPQCETEEEYVEDLVEFLDHEVEEDWDIERSPSSREGTPDVLVGDALAIEVKCDLSKAERDRLIGQTAAYSREWVTWIVLIDTPASRAGALEGLLADKGLQHILVFSF